MRNPGLSNVDGAKWIGGLLVSNYLNNLTWHYGYFEWRMRMRIPNPIRGMFPALWLFNNVLIRSDGYEGAEIDMFEVFGSSSGMPWQSGWHENPSGTSGDAGAMNHSITDWHRYGVDWTANTVAYYLDGVQTFVCDPSVPAWFQNANMGVRIDYVMDPNWLSAGDPGLSTPTDPPVGITSQLQVDYVRVYSSLPTNLAPGSTDPL